MQEFMPEQKIIQCLKRLGEELETLKVLQPIRILMIGGAYMITQIGNRELTEDSASHLKPFWGRGWLIACFSSIME